MIIDRFLSKKEVLNAVAKYSHKNVSELILYHLFDARFKLLPEELIIF